MTYPSSRIIGRIGGIILIIATVIIFYIPITEYQTRITIRIVIIIIDIVAIISIIILKIRERSKSTRKSGMFLIQKRMIYIINFKNSIFSFEKPGDIYNILI